MLRDLICEGLNRSKIVDKYTPQVMHVVKVTSSRKIVKRRKRVRTKRVPVNNLWQLWGLIDEVSEVKP